MIMINLKLLFELWFMIISTFQGLPHWVSLQGVVLHGKSPVPAEIRVKCDPEGSDFWHLPERSRWIPHGQQGVSNDEEFKFERKVYGNDIQMHFQKFLQNCAIHIFGKMEYNHQPALGKSKPEFPRPNEAMIDNVIQVVEQHTPRAGELMKLVTHITSG